jgi:pantoate--beta-alanine ligase
MLIFESPSAMAAWSSAQRSDHKTIGFVPTMGALHDGHLMLIHEAQQVSDVVVVSIFVNPLQFNRRDDFEHYPRPAAQDLERCRERGVTAVYAPTADAMYPAGFDTHIEVGQLAQPLEGAGRPGHFRGVATVVTKLFNAVQPHVAFFGEKDFQQLTVIKRMVIDLDMPINIVGCITTREPDGLALSSRNARLSPTQRDAAIVVPEALAAISAAHERGITSSRELRDIATHVVRQQPLARLEYIDIVDPHTLHQVDTVDAEVRVVIAVWVGDVRLIDNIALSK